MAARQFATDTAAPDASAGRQEPPPSPEAIATSLPQLEAIEFLGRGGMGVVYKARQKSLGRTVALKLLAPERLGDADFAARFEREAKALAALNHPNIVTVHDFGKAGEFYYLLMEFVDGVNLRQAMSAGRFTPEQSLAIVPPVCEALQYAHDHGIVHRDIKPENLLLDKEGRVKIADFGIAKMLGTEASIPGVLELESQPAGTPQYMAPEQKEHRGADHRADIYSLGVVLYEMLVGELPTAKLQPPSRKVQIDVRLDEIVLRALDKMPELRFQTAADFRTQVEAVTNGAGLPSAEANVAANPPRFSHMAVIGACWAPIAIVAFFAAYLILDRSRRGSGPEWWQAGPAMLLLLIAVSAPFGTSILGWLAVGQIQRSGGRIRGLALAVFDGLLFPLMALNALVVLAGVALAKMFVDFYANPSMIGVPGARPDFLTWLANGLSRKTTLVVPLAVAVAVLVDLLVVRGVLRAVRKGDASAPAASDATGNEAQAASISIILALIATALGALAAIRSGGAWPAMALSLLFAGLSIFMALPVRRLSVGKSAIVIAALGAILWPLAALVVQLGRPGSVASVSRIEKVVVAVDQAVISQPRHDGEGMTIAFGSADNRWTPSGVYLEAMLDIRLEPHWYGGGANWVVRTRRGIHSGYRLDGPPGPMLGKVVFHPGTPAPNTDGTYVIGEYRPEVGAPMPIAVKIENDQAEALNKTSTPKPLPPPERIDFKVLRVENPPGTRDILLHFERDTNYGLAIEVWQDVTASPDGKAPKEGYRTWQQKTWVGLNGGRILGWKLPEEFTAAEVSALAKAMEKKWKGPHPLPDGAAPEFAAALHRDGWKYHLATKVLREPGSPRPPAPAGALFTAEQPIHLPADALVRLTLGRSANDGPKTPMGEALVFKTAPDRPTGFLLRWHAYPAPLGKFGNSWILDLTDPDTGVIFHRVEDRFAMPVKLTSPDVPPLPHVSAARQLSDSGNWPPFRLLHAEEPTAPGAAPAAWWDVFATVACPSDRPEPAFQMPPAHRKAYGGKSSEPASGSTDQVSHPPRFGPLIERVITHPADGMAHRLHFPILLSHRCGA